MSTDEPESDRSSEGGAPESVAPPERVGPYRVGPRIGRGGMGSVHVATEIATGRRVALKLVKEGASERACARLLREARAARAAASDQVVEVLGAGLGDDGRPYVAMELLEGEDLSAWLRREGRLELEDALDVADQLLAGLERVHAAGVVHRDLKPENLVVLAGLGAPSTRVTADGSEPARTPPRIKIVDFGVSKVRAGGQLVPGSLTREGIVLGTPLYMSPEQAQGLPDVDERSDLWSAGAILYQCLAGRAPYAGATYEQIVVAICSSDADDVRRRNPAVPEPIAAVLRRALCRDRRRRFQDARSMRLALARARSGEVDAAGMDVATVPFTGHPGSDGASTPPSMPTEAIPLRRRRRSGRPPGALAVAATSLALGVLIAIAAVTAYRVRATDGAPAASEAASSSPPPAPAPLVPLAEETVVAASEPPPAASSAVRSPPAPPSTTTRKRALGSGLELKDR